MNIASILSVLMSLYLATCNRVPMQPVDTTDIIVTHLGDGQDDQFATLRSAFVSSNPGYDLAYIHAVSQIDPLDKHRVLFIQEGGGTATITEQESSKFSVGDIVILLPNQSIRTDSAFSALAFEVPEAPPGEIPSFIRPDWDENITDTPGGCATETNAYRRILLTWKKEVGPYVYHSINAHRVRITNSFSHYHPVIGGFDEFYLVQMVQPTARLITSNRVDLIENPSNVTKKQAQNLLKTTPLKVGDLVYLPRGVMHRGLGSVLAQVITVPGFVPGAEIGVDHHLHTINQKLGLGESEQIEYNQEASKYQIIK